MTCRKAPPEERQGGCREAARGRCTAKGPAEGQWTTLGKFSVLRIPTRGAGRSRHCVTGKDRGRGERSSPA